MHILLPTTVLLLSTFGFASPTPVNTSNPTVASLDTSTTISPEPIPPEFSMTPIYSAVSLDEDHCLCVAVQYLGILGSGPFSEPLQTKSYWDDHLPFVVITNRSPQTEGSVEARFLIWGTYLGIKDMIESRQFKNVNFVLRWEGKIVGIVSIKSRLAPSPLLLPGRRNSSDVLQRRVFSSPDQLHLYQSESLNGTSFNQSALLASSRNVEVEFGCQALDEPVPKYSTIMALMEGILTVAPRMTRHRLRETVQVQLPAPYSVRLQVLPVQEGFVEPYVTYGIVATQIRQIPALLYLTAHRWAAVKFYISLDGNEVAKGGISRHAGANAMQKGRWFSTDVTQTSRRDVASFEEHPTHGMGQAKRAVTFNI